MFYALRIWVRGLRLGLTRPGRLRRTAFALAILLPWAVLRAAVAVGRGLDHILFPGFRRQEIHDPVYIIGAPRSGTTFLHDLFALDEERFVPLNLYETLLPSISLCRAVEAVAALDRVLGRPLGRLAGAIERRAFGGWEGIHRTAFGRTEEPEGIWVLRMLTPAVFLLFPYFDELPELESLEGLRDARARRAAVAFYVGSLRRHLYRHRGRTEGRRLLVKTVLFSSRIEAVRDAVPGIRFVYARRDPRVAIPSALSMLTKPWGVHSPAMVGDTPESRRFARLLVDAYRRYEAARSQASPGEWHDVDFERLVADPRGVVNEAYEWLGLEPGPGRDARLEARIAAAPTASTHRYGLEGFGLAAADIEVALPELTGESPLA